MIGVKTLLDKERFNLEMHLQKEEQILFAFILAIYEAYKHGQTPPRAHFGTIRNLIRMMEREHETTGEAFKTIRELTNNFTPPSGACNTYMVLLQELEEFERNLLMCTFFWKMNYYIRKPFF